MVQITRESLRRITEEALASAQRELADKQGRIFASAMKQLAVDVTAGRNYSVAMSLKGGVDYESTATSRRTLGAKQLTGVAALLFARCQVFAPTLEYWSKVEGCQRDEYTVEGFNIVLHWSGVDDLLAKLSSLKEDSTVEAIRQGILAAQEAITTKAAGILAQLKDKATIQARAGKSWAIVMSLKAGADFEIPSGKQMTAIQPDWLGPVARAVFDACQSFTPTFEYWSHVEGCQRDEYTVEGINIIVHW